jgi:hypothetical protein
VGVGSQAVGKIEAADFERRKKVMFPRGNFIVWIGILRRHGFLESLRSGGAL